MPTKIIPQVIACLVLIFLAVMLIGCSPAASPVVPNPATATLPETPTALKQSPSPTSPLTPVLTPARFNTVIPSHTPLPEMRTRQAQESARITATRRAEAAMRDVLETESPSFPFACDDNTLSEQLSPDKKWLLLDCGTFKDRADNKMIVGNRSGTKWELKLVDFSVPQVSIESTPLGSIYPVHWSPDGAYLYFASYAGWEGGGTCFYGFGPRGLFRLDLLTGKTSAIVPLLPSTDYGDYRISFSPNGRRLAYSKSYRKGGNSFDLLDLRSGEKTTFPTEDDNGDFTWSPDGASLAYSTSLCTFDPQIVIRSFIKILTIADLSTRTIAQSNTDFLTIQGWSPEDNLLTIERESYGDGANQPTTLSVDPNKSIVISSASPTP